MKARHIYRKTLLAAAIGAALATSATLAPTITRAQSADATLRGRAPANADITAKNLATGATRRTKASADGLYTIPGLQPGSYQIDAGPGTEQTVTVTVASIATVDLGSAAPAEEAAEIT